jgi:putative transposase
MLRKFKWQAGYASFSVSPSKLSALVEYIDSQEEHHRHVTFQQEYRKLLRLHNIPFDERWVWD